MPDESAAKVSWAGVKTAGVQHFSRAFRRDLGGGLADADEQASLAAPVADRPAVTGTRAQDYLAWRRSMLWVTALLLGGSALFSLANFVINLASDDEGLGQVLDVGFLRFLDFLGLAAAIYLPIAAWRGCQRWDNLRLSHRRVRLGWLVGFLVPFVTALVPVKALLQFEAPTTLEVAQAQAQASQGVGMFVGLMLFLKLVPSVLAIFIGAIRSALTLEQLVPESSLPGWVATVAAPIFAVVALAVFVLFHQIGGDWLLLIGFALIVANYLLIARDGPALIRPQSNAQSVEALRRIWGRSRILLSLGSLALLIALFTIDFFGGKKLFGFWSDGALMTPVDLFELVLALVGRSLFTLVLFCDLLLGVLHYARREAQNLPIDLTVSLEQKVQEYGEIGIGDLARRPAAPPPPV
jgi:hypothetical protein